MGSPLDRAVLIALAWVLVALPLFLSSARADSAWAEVTSGGTSRASALFPGVERAIRACANRHRRAAGLKPLRPSGVLAEAARLHAHNMAVHGFFSHTDQRKRGPLERVQIFDSEDRFAFVGENIAAGYGSPRLACRGWMNSPGHRENILREGFTTIGAGFARGGPLDRYYVQVFGRREGLSR